VLLRVPARGRMTYLRRRLRPSSLGSAGRMRCFQILCDTTSCGGVAEACSRLWLARVGGCLSPRGNRSANPRARQRSHDVSAKAPSAFEPGIGRTYEIFPDIMRHHELRRGGGACSRLWLARVGGCLSPRGNRSATPRARQMSHDVSAKAPSVFEPGIGRTYEIFPDIMRHHELREGGGGVLAAVASTRRRVSLAAREPKCYSACSPEVA
jgi:hypothetical protein